MTKVIIRTFAGLSSYRGSNDSLYPPVNRNTSGLEHQHFFFFFFSRSTLFHYCKFYNFFKLNIVFFFKTYKLIIYFFFQKKFRHKCIVPQCGEDCHSVSRLCTTACNIVRTFLMICLESCSPQVAH